MHRTAFILAALCSLVGVAALAGTAPWKPEIKFLKIGVATAGGDWFRAGAKFATMVSEAIPELAATTLVGGAIVNVKNVAKGDAQMAFSLTPYPENGYHGRHEFKEPLPNIRLMAANVGRKVSLCLMVLKDSPIKSLYDIKGKRITPGDRGWGTTHLAEAIMTAAGMPPDKFKAEGGTISYLSITDRAKALQDRNLDAIFMPCQVNYPDLMVVQQAVGLRIIGFDEALLAKAMEMIPGTVSAPIPKGLYGIVEADIPSVGFIQQMIVRDDLSEELVYRLTKLWWERVKEIEEIAPTFNPSDPKRALEGATIPVHPGALRYYREIGVVG
jgi:TRAP transporter TAXI family solute receptor